MVEHSPKSWQARKKNHHGSIRTAPKRFTVVFENKTATRSVYTAVVLGQPAGLCYGGVFVSGRRLARLICQSEFGEKSNLTFCTITCGAEFSK